MFEPSWVRHCLGKTASLSWQKLRHCLGKTASLSWQKLRHYLGKKYATVLAKMVIVFISV